ncbi:Hypothetical protein DEACI_2247 [Acididesulfobacillus acetoxydans]|uniref:Uncharacterized protein n=1 Tax=Acididesulfobacillus acetoxydans TaxID=1561005 RepID=A0A8S0X5E9_9FIRM|nr:Hypothetical protein DEACI_2247 [Acididesulfobacillus acetoxydans]CEJ07067.1 Hypothetical protein DEACI_1523 [Acididesulfobacillus acetoxydans]
MSFVFETVRNVLDGLPFVQSDFQQLSRIQVFESHLGFDKGQRAGDIRDVKKGFDVLCKRNFRISNFQSGVCPMIL